MVSGAEGWEGICAFVRTKLDWLRRFLPYANGIPSADCLGWVMARLSPGAFQNCFVAWTRLVAKLSAGEIVAQGADYVLAVKENQPHLHAAIVDYFETAEATQFQAVPVHFIEQTDVGHGP